MTRAAALLRGPEGSQRATLLELFFDLVFVAALAVTSMTLAADPTWTGVLHTVIPLVAIWWVWSITALLTDFYDPQRLPIQITLAGVMLGTIVMTAVLPTAFGAQGLIFAAANVAIHLGRGLLLVSVLRGHIAQVRAARFMFWFAVSGVGWLVGAYLGQTARSVLWALAVTVDLVAAGFRYPTPWFGRVPLAQYGRAGEHLGERYQQFIILSLGDLILVAGLGYSRREFDVAGALTILVTFATSVLFWQIYVHRAGSLLLVSAVRRPGRAVRWAPYTHLIMVIGIVFTATGFDLLIAGSGPTTPSSWLIFMIGGPFLFLVGRITFEYQVFGRVSWVRRPVPFLLVAVSPAMTLIPPLGVAAVVAGILFGLALVEGIRVRRHRAPQSIRLIDQP